MRMSQKSLRRFLIVAAVLSALLLIDGIVLKATNGLSSDSTPVLPVLGGSFAKTHNSGTSLIVLGALMALLTLLGWWTRARRQRGTQTAGHTQAVASPPGTGTSTSAGSDS
jgi:hypothetical protein